MGVIKTCKRCQNDFEFKGGSLFCTPDCQSGWVDDRSKIYGVFVKANKNQPQDLQKGRKIYEAWLQTGKID
jgi:hypothetical protein